MKRGHGLDWIVCGALQCLMLDISALSSCSILLSLFIPNVSYLTSNSLLLFINKISFCSLLIIFLQIRHPTKYAMSYSRLYAPIYNYNLNSAETKFVLSHFSPKQRVLQFPPSNKYNPRCQFAYWKYSIKWVTFPSTD